MSLKYVPPVNPTGSQEVTIPGNTFQVYKDEGGSMGGGCGGVVHSPIFSANVPASSTGFNYCAECIDEIIMEVNCPTS